METEDYVDFLSRLTEIEFPKNKVLDIANYAKNSSISVKKNL